MSDKITDRCPDCGEIVFEGKDTFYCQSCETWFSREEMEKEITVEEMVNLLGSMWNCYCHMMGDSPSMADGTDDKRHEAIRKLILGENNEDHK